MDDESKNIVHLSYIYIRVECTIFFDSFSMLKHASSTDEQYKSAWCTSILPMY